MNRPTRALHNRGNVASGPNTYHLEARFVRLEGKGKKTNFHRIDQE
jgi:hypothetical protein